MLGKEKVKALLLNQFTNKQSPLYMLVAYGIFKYFIVTDYPMIITVEHNDSTNLNQIQFEEFDDNILESAYLITDLNDMHVSTDDFEALVPTIFKEEIEITNTGIIFRYGRYAIAHNNYHFRLKKESLAQVVEFDLMKYAMSCVGCTSPKDLENQLLAEFDNDELKVRVITEPNSKYAEQIKNTDWFKLLDRKLKRNVLSYFRDEIRKLPGWYFGDTMNSFYGLMKVLQGDDAKFLSYHQVVNEEFYK